jgi:hypothetical protein
MTKKLKLIFIIIIELYYIKLGNKKNLFSKRNKKNNNYEIYYSIKRRLYNIISNILKKNITSIDSLIINGSFNFGNFMISLNNAIIFCEYLRCQRIIIQSISNIYIKNKIIYPKYNISIESNQFFNFNNNSMIVNLRFFYYQLNFVLLGKVNRFFIFREEILSNLPQVKVHPDDLYIYIRGGDIFRILNKSFYCYAQPPLCFYENILNKFNFKNAIIISEDKLNPLVSILLKKYNFIKYNKNNIKVDISYLVNSYNIVSAKSSFIISIIKLNNNLKFLWEYDFYLLSERFRHLHYSVYTFLFKYIIYNMHASENYKKLMFPFINSVKQRKLMIEEKCDINFCIIPPRII